MSISEYMRHEYGLVPEDLERGTPPAYVIELPALVLVIADGRVLKLGDVLTVGPAAYTVTGFERLTSSGMIRILWQASGHMAERPKGAPEWN